MNMRSFFAHVLVSILACGASMATTLHATTLHAQPTPSVDQLRAAITEARRDPNGNVPQGTFDSIDYLVDVADRINGSFATQSESWRRRAARYLAETRNGRDPYVSERGIITNRGYRSPVSTRLQGYAIYLPPGYDPSRPWPLYVALHGGSSNGNLFLGVVLGNNMSWLEYDRHLWDDYTPVWSPDWIVVAPDGFGQVMWRWMGERDVLDVIDDVERHYNVDANRVVLGGLSNGGVGAYSIGSRYASRFSVVHAMAGAPSWLQYAGGNFVPEEQIALERLSGLHLAENTVNTRFFFYHGRTDGGPMKPEYVTEYSRRLEELSIPRNETWYDTGHDILYLVHRHGKIYSRIADIRRNPSPSEVRIVTGDYRANRQHWVTVTRIVSYPRLARVRASVQGSKLEATTERVRALSFDLRNVPFASGNTAELVIDGQRVYSGSRLQLGHIIHAIKRENTWRLGYPPDLAGSEREKKPGLGGPITDAYYDRMVHVYGTQTPDHTEALRRAAQRAARGWPVWLWTVQQEVVADRDVTDAMMRSAHLVLYGTPGDNSVLERIRTSLPIRVESDAVVVGNERYEGNDVGTRFIYPNPLAPERYVIVQSGVTTDAVEAGNRLPDFVPDYVVYDRESTRSRPRLTAGGRRQRALGYFDDHWKLNRAPTTGSERSEPAGGRLAAKARDSSDAQQRSNRSRAVWRGGRAAHPQTKVRSEPAGGRLAAKARDSSDAQQRSNRSRAVWRGGRAAHPQSEGSDPEAEAPADPSLLPVPVAPPAPAPPERFAAPRSDPAGRIARQIANRARTFENFRARTPGATWSVSDRAVWSIRRERACIDALRRAQISVRPSLAELTPVPNPVELLGSIDGVWFRSIHEERPFVISCELAARLVDLVRIVKRHGVRGVDVMSAVRDRPRSSFHTMGLALDIARFWTGRGWLSVFHDFEATPGFETCNAPEPSKRAARTLLRIACDLQRSQRFSSILTPNYNAGHRDHFHIDIRPDDPRVFLR